MLYKNNAIIMKRLILILLLTFCGMINNIYAQQRRPIDSQHPLWMVHIDVWNAADPQKIIDLMPEDIRPYICMNLSLSCRYDTDRAVYISPQNAMRTNKSWATVCQQNKMWFTCQPASGGHTHLQPNDLETFEYMFKHYPNFLGWNFAEQFWGFDENALYSAKQTDQIALFANLVEMSHKYGGFLTISFCGNIWSHGLSPIGMMKRNNKLLQACRNYPEAILWLYKYTTTSCFYNCESVCWSPFVSGLAKNYGVRYDNCGWKGAMDKMFGENNHTKYPIAAGIGTVMEQMCVNGGSVWDAPETIPTESFTETNKTTVDGYTQRNWASFDGFKGAWIDMFRKIVDGTMYIPTRQEVVDKTKIIVIADMTSGSDEDKYASWGDLYDGLYKQNDPVNREDGHWMNNSCYFKKTGRYGAIPVALELKDDLAKSIPLQVKKSSYKSRWSSIDKKVTDFNNKYPEVSNGDLYVNRFKNQLITYTPYTYLNKKRTATGEIPLEYNTCNNLRLTLGMLGSGVVREYNDHLDFYLNNYRTDTTKLVTETIVVTGVKTEPTYTMSTRLLAKGNATATWDQANGKYTLTVNHLGGVDIRINCKGNATNRKTDVANSNSLTFDLPKQPEEYHGEIIIEAEDMNYKNIKRCVTDQYYSYPNIKGHAGNGFMDMGTNTAGTLRHQLTLNEGGNYRISIRYMNATKAGRFTAKINGTNSQVNYDRANYNDWKKVTFDTTLKKGKNDLILTNTSGEALYIDQIIYTPTNIEPEKFEINIRKASYGSVTSDISEAKEGDVVTLHINANKGYLLKDLKMINGVNFTMGTTIKFISYDYEAGELTFIMPDDMITLQPVFARAEEVNPAEGKIIYSLDFNNTGEGTLPPGWRCVQENDDIHEYPNSYALGARTFYGFNGYQGHALYWRNNCAEYGRQNNYPLALEPGNYNLSYTMAAWKEMPNFNVKILNSNEETIATSDKFDATPNTNGDKTADVTNAETHQLAFTVKNNGNYIISFQNTSTYAANFHEFLLLGCSLTKKDNANSIRIIDERNNEEQIIYDLQGCRTKNPSNGIYIKNGKKIYIK